MIKRILIFLLFIYCFYSNIIIALLKISWLKPLLSVSILLVLILGLAINYKDYSHKKVLILPFFLVIIFVSIWPKMGYINLFYTLFFGWILMQNIKFSLKIIKITFFIQLVLVLYEAISVNVIYNFVESGVLANNKFEYESIDQTIIGFRPKGLFAGTLIATSFIIYLSMIFRNNLKMLLLIFFMAVIVNGRLAILISALILFLKIFKSYDIIIFNRINTFKKILFFTLPLIIILFVIALALPSSNFENLTNTFDLSSTSNFGRLFRYTQAIITYLDYNFVQKLFGNPLNEIYDQYDRVVASESGFLSMFLDIGLIGVIFYMYYFIKAWKSDNNKLIGFETKIISFKFLVLIMFFSFLQYEHINGNVRGMLFWFLFLSQLYSNKLRKKKLELKKI